MVKTYIPFQPTLSKLGTQRYGLSVQYQTPCPILQASVQTYLQISISQPSPYPVIPDGTQALYFSKTGAMFSGAQQSAITVPLLAAGDYLGIWFKPAALRHFFRLQLSEINNQLVDLSYLADPQLYLLHQSLYQQNHFAARWPLLEHWLLSRYQPQPRAQLCQALALIEHHQGELSVAKLAKQIGWSSRHLNRQFTQFVGLNTKTFSQIVRAQTVCQQLFSQPINTPLQHSFFDQSHLIKSFRQFFNASPQQLISTYRSDSYN